MTTMTLPQPLPAIPWRCNGGINPLIRTEKELRECCSDDAELNAAIQHMKIHLECHHKLPSGELTLATPTEVCSRYSELRDIVRGKEILHGINTTAQLLAKHGNTHCRAECTSIRDLQRCFAILGGYNDLDAGVASHQFGKFNRAAYYGVNNPNTGSDAFSYVFGFEGSPVVYITFRCYYLKNVLTSDWRHSVEYSIDDFRSDCASLARHTLADESDCVDADERGVKWRLWWD